MSRDDLMKSDLLSEVLLLGSGVALIMGLMMLLALALTHAPALQ